MKKMFLILMALTMFTSLAGCGEDSAEKESSVAEVTEAATEEETTPSPEDENIDTPAEPNEEIVDGGDAGSAGSSALPENVTYAQYLLSDFKAIVAENPDMTADEIAAELSANEAILFASMYMPVEPGFLSGFTTEITGFESGSMFGPAMGSIAFIGYVFELSDESQAEAFVTTLKDNADPRWQICVEAEETVCEAEGNKVFFVMAPLSNEG